MSLRKSFHLKRRKKENQRNWRRSGRERDIEETKRGRLRRKMVPNDRERNFGLEWRGKPKR
jgi:hypothetical protein